MTRYAGFSGNRDNGDRPEFEIILDGRFEITRGQAQDTRHGDDRMLRLNPSSF